MPWPIPVAGCVLALPLAAACKPASPADPPAETAAPTTPADTDGSWRSALYPADWTPDFVGPDGNALPDFSYAGYHRSEAPLPEAWPGLAVDVTAYGASPGSADNTAAFQAAIDAVQDAGGGAVEIPDGTWTFTGTLRVAATGVLLRGASREGTRLYFAALALDGASVTFAGAPAADLGSTPLVEDGAARGHVVRVADASGFEVGEDVLLDWEITQAFVDAHAMTGIWDSGDNSALGLRKVFFRREITGIAGDVITLDVPLRADALVRDGAALRPDTGAIAECGVAHLSLANAVDETAALAAPRAHVLSFSRAKDCFVTDVGTFDPAEEPSAAHLRSGGIEIVESKRLTVADSEMSHARHHGDGGAGYAFEASMSSDVLFVDDHTEDVRHGFIQNWDFGASGLVWLRCTAIDDTAINSGFATPGRSELHHRLAMANLFDTVSDTAGFAAYNRGTESSNAGHAGTETVFWNTSGAGADSRLSSYQVGRGYVIGTTDLTALVVPDLIDAALHAADGTDPVDWLEGVDAGATLDPPSLFEDQLARRLGR
jgi:hypothetical protein